MIDQKMKSNKKNSKETNPKKSSKLYESYQGDQAYSQKSPSLMLSRKDNSQGKLGRKRRVKKNRESIGEGSGLHRDRSRSKDRERILNLRPTVNQKKAERPPDNKFAFSQTPSNLSELDYLEKLTGYMKTRLETFTVKSKTLKDIVSIALKLKQIDFKKINSSKVMESKIGQTCTSLSSMIQEAMEYVLEFQSSKDLVEETINDITEKIQSVVLSNYFNKPINDVKLDLSAKSTPKKSSISHAISTQYDQTPEHIARVSHDIDTKALSLNRIREHRYDDHISLAPNKTADSARIKENIPELSIERTKVVRGELRAKKDRIKIVSKKCKDVRQNMEHCPKNIEALNDPYKIKRVAIENSQKCEPSNMKIKSIKETPKEVLVQNDNLLQYADIQSQSLDIIQTGSTFKGKASLEPRAECGPRVKVVSPEKKTHLNDMKPISTFHLINTIPKEGLTERGCINKYQGGIDLRRAGLDWKTSPIRSRIEKSNLEEIPPEASSFVFPDLKRRVVKKFSKVLKSVEAFQQHNKNDRRLIAQKWFDSIYEPGMDSDQILHNLISQIEPALVYNLVNYLEREQRESRTDKTAI